MVFAERGRLETHMSVHVEKDDPSIFTPLGRRLSARILPFLPHSILPDHVTAIGFAFWLLAGLALYLASFAPVWFLVAAASTFLRWLADELDGELARARDLASERGFFLDFYLDCVGGTAVGFGLASASYTLSPLVIVYTLLYLNGVVLAACSMFLRRRFPLGRFGPSEVQAALIVLSLLCFFRPGSITTIAGVPFSWFDLALLAMFPICFIEWLVTMIRFTRQLKPAQRAVGQASNTPSSEEHT